MTMEKRRLTFEDALDVEHNRCPSCEVETNTTTLRHVGRGFHCRTCDAIFQLDEDGYYYELQ